MDDLDDEWRLLNGGSTLIRVLCWTDELTKESGGEKVRLC